MNDMTKQVIIILSAALVILIMAIIITIRVTRIKDDRRYRMSQTTYRHQLYQMKEKLELDAFTLRTYQAILRALYRDSLNEHEDESEE